ncbi:addiction module protein [Nannocystis sp.]|uniref:addiction module protein n=1 Tax=Nannocystis sp. TaxID=1962667 RepID=UPI0025D77EE6|nr:addiction module protein [Nannocystis sp.]MBK7826454.1 addiction module protein [Nannocystis sp.]
MTRDALLAEVMRLPIEERRALALEVLEHSDGEEAMHPDIEASHRAELDRRLQLIDAGLMKYSPWDEVRARSSAARLPASGL